MLTDAQKADAARALQSEGVGHWLFSQKTLQTAIITGCHPAQYNGAAVGQLTTTYIMRQAALRVLSSAGIDQAKLESTWKTTSTAIRYFITEHARAVVEGRNQNNLLVQVNPEPLYAALGLEGASKAMREAAASYYFNQEFERLLLERDA